MTEATKSPEELAAEQAVIAAQAQKLKEEKAAAKAVKDAEKAEAKRLKDLAKADAKLAKDAEKTEKASAKAQAKLDAEAAKVANQMPESNGVRRPKPDGLCGRAWAIFDQISATKGSACSIKEALEVSNPQGLNEANVKAEYARWRKFFGVTGRIEASKPVVETAVQ